jgi:KipI family sensor histidine kinase inhibitor
MAAGSSMQFHAYGDSGLLVECDAAEQEDRWLLAQHLGRELRALAPPGVVDLVASFASVFVTYDPLVTTRHDVEQHVRRAETAPVSAPKPQTFRIPVVYGGQHGPELAQVADLLDLSEDEVVDLHSSHPWVVRLVGSPAGAPLMDGPALPRSIPRLSSPRTRVPAGSLGLSGSQSIVYNSPSPGGWQLVGRTPMRLFDVTVPPHVAYCPGDVIRFVPIRADEWDRWAGSSLLAGGER